MMEYVRHMFGQKYVVGFLLDEQEVVLVRKKRPDWQRNKLNGVGGKIENNETPLDAMRREFKEETGLSVQQWDPMCTILWDQDPAGDGAGLVHFYRSLWTRPEKIATMVRTTTDEPIEVHKPYTVPTRRDIIPNLSWLIPLALYTYDAYKPFKVQTV